MQESTDARQRAPMTSKDGAATPFETSDVMGELLSGLQQTAEVIVPRFLATMPASYFMDTDQATRLSHIKAIIAAQASGLSQAMTLRNEERTRYTIISDRSYPGQLSELVTQLPHELPLCSARVYTATDGSRVLDVFEFGEGAYFDPGDPQQRTKADAVLAYAGQQAMDIALDTLAEHFRQCTAEYLRTVPEAHICQHFRLVERIRATGNTIVTLENRPDYQLNSITVGVNSAERRRLFECISRYLGQSDIDIQRAYLDGFDGHGRESVSLLSFLVRETADGMLDTGSDRWVRIATDLRRLVQLDDAVLDLARRLPESNLLHAEVLLSLSHLAHQLLVKRDPLAFTRQRILRVALRYRDHSHAIVRLFLERFAAGGEQAYTRQAPPLTERLEREVDEYGERLILSTLLQAVGVTLRTNVYAPDRQALALRIEPSFLTAPDREEAPYGVFFIHGRHFDGFHVRFRDIARGGVRIVSPLGQDRYTLESERLYDEVYGLAYAQQLKNKDIPEGGAKGVLLAQPGADLNRVGRAYADALLDLVIADTGADRRRPDYYGKTELLYLGPDENISRALIAWIIERARRRGHPMPNVFMSSKPGAGINHKEYGVTSEGVTVFLEAALRARGIDPRQQAFTLKLTGGPDGDVAGNEIRILNREYGANARILGIADGSGCLEDPDGLDYAELLRLVTEEKPVSAFNPRRLGPRGRLLSIDQSGGLQARNSLHNRLVTDAFIPAGGRPRTINAENWRDFISAGGMPASNVIVEGANLFITPEARQCLSECGVIIIKDSSANKCGVICSSYEIIASMLLSEDEFLEIKPRFVDEVLIRLRTLARLEAHTLFREHYHKPGIPLADLSTRLSRAIIRVNDAVSNTLGEMAEADRLLARRLVREYLPPVLLERSGEQVFERIPAPYLNQVIASALSSKIVYREGLDWFEHMPDQSTAALAVHYLRQETETQHLVEEIEGSTLAGRERIAELLREGGTGAALRRALGCGSFK